MTFDLARLGIAYAHLIASCVALGLVLLSDYDLARRLVRGDSASIDPRHLDGMQRVLGRALLLLWLTGSGLVAIDVRTKGIDVLLNPALQSKFAVVALLTLNAVILHRTVLPMLMRAGALMRLAFSARTLAVLVGAVSGVSWAYAAMLGIVRPVGEGFTLARILGAYPVLVGSCFVAMVALTAWSQARARWAHRGFRNAPMHPVLLRSVPGAAERRAP